MIELFEISKAGRIFAHAETVTAGGSAVTDGYVYVRLVRCSDGYAFDWNDAFFKESGHILEYLDLPHVGNGLYYSQLSVEQSGGTTTDIDMIDGELLRVDGYVRPASGSSTPIEGRILQCTQSIYASAMASNRHETNEVVSPNIDEVYAIDGYTLLGTHNLLDINNNSISDLQTGQLAKRSGNTQ